MMTTYFFPLLSVIALCAFWAIFQVWLTRHDPDAETASRKCGACGRQDECADQRNIREKHDRQEFL